MNSVDQLSGAADSASSEARAAYVSFYVFASYFATTVGATSHEELLRGSEVAMPALGVGLPVVGFYVLVPPLFVLFHTLLLIQLNVLARPVRRLNKATSDAGDVFSPPFIVSQFMLGNIRGFLVRPMVYVAMWLSLIGLPVGVLILVQVRFLPYHHELVTSWHRILIIFDLALVWLLWPRILKPASSTRMVSAMPDHRQPRDQGIDSPRDRFRAGIARIADLVGKARGRLGLVLLTALTLLFSWNLATVPGSPAALAQVAGRDVPEADTAFAHRACHWTWKPWRYFTPVSAPPAVAGGPSRTVSCLSYLLFEAPTTPLNMRRNIKLRDRDLVEPPPADTVERLGPDQAWREHGRGLDLRGRDLRYADLSFSDLRKVDLRGADLLGANLASADLRYVRAGDVRLEVFDVCDSSLRVSDHRGEYCLNRLSGANLRNADLRFSQFRRADFRQANLDFARLQGIDLTGAHLDDASLISVSLEGAELQSAKMNRARLGGARLAGANLAEASLHAAFLERADLTLARLRCARLVDADLSQTRLDGAFLLDADLTRSILTNAYLAGADLRGVKLNHVMLGDIEGAAFFGWTDIRATDQETLKTVFDSVPHEITPEALPTIEPERYERKLASLLVGKACRPNVTPFVVQSLVRRVIDDLYINRFQYRAHHKQIAKRLLDRSVDEKFGGCPPAADLPEHMRTNLQRINQGLRIPL